MKQETQKSFADFSESISEVKEHIHTLGKQTVMGDSSFLKLFARTIEAALAGGNGKPFVFEHNVAKRERSFFGILSMEAKKGVPTTMEEMALGLVHELCLLCEDVEESARNWTAREVVALNLIQKLASEFRKGSEGCFFSVCLSKLFERADVQAKQAIATEIEA